MMASGATERQSLLSNPANARPPKPPRTVAFSEATTHESSSPAVPFPPSPTRPLPIGNPNYPPAQNGTQPMLATFNSKLRRRNSAGAPLTSPRQPLAGPKLGAQRTTKKTQKLTLLPNPEPEDEPDEESGRDVYSQFTRIKDPTARRDAARLGKADRERLPRVTAYSTASSYKQDGLLKYLKGKAKQRGAAPKQFDECIYTPYDYNYGRPKDRQASNTPSMPSDDLDIARSPSNLLQNRERRRSDSALEVEEHTQARREDLMDLAARSSNMTIPEDGESSNAPQSLVRLPSDDREPVNPDLDIEVHTPEVFLFDYGTVVVWGMTLAQEKRFLKEISKFENEKLAPDDVETEEFNFYYTREYQARIYNDFISLREKRNYMTKLAISHALAQSVKTSLFEDLLSTTIADTTPLPGLLANTGRISLSRRDINKKIGELFILRINIHLQGSVLDSPELMWSEPTLEPIYAAMRSYLEMDQRVELMTERLSVLGDLLAVLRDQAGTRHGEWLEWIVIILIAAEILVAAVNIVVDLYAGVE